jgi:hypothetical protein
VEFSTLTVVDGRPVFHPLTVEEVTALLAANNEDEAPEK